MDYYGNVVSSENLGTCAAVYAGTDLDLPDLGRVTAVVDGIGNFSQFTVIGKSVKHLAHNGVADANVQT